MSTPYDLDTPEPEQRPGGTEQQSSQSIPPSPYDAPSRLGQAPPAPRASDILREHTAYNAQPRRISNINGGERAATPFDDVARGIFLLALLVAVVALGYLLYGLWGGMLANPSFQSLPKPDQTRIGQNIDTVVLVLKIGLFVALLAFLFLFYHEETSGYILLATSVFLYLAIPFLTLQILNFNRESTSHMAREALNMLKAMAWMPGVPGSLLIVYDIYRRIAGGMEEAQIRRATLRYGQGVGRQIKHRNVFLGPCWNTPYCRDSIRSKCPVFVAKKGPCWKNKRGCMCEESIILQAQAGDWKQRVAGAVGQMEAKSSPNTTLLGGSGGINHPILTMEQKKERCRQCVIYNKHQEQKYKLLVAATFVVVFGIIALLKSNLVTLVNTVCIAANSVMGRLSYTSASASTQPTGPVLDTTLNGPLVWVILGVITMIILSKLLQLVEYCCFKLKI